MAGKRRHRWKHLQGGRDCLRCDAYVSEWTGARGGLHFDYKPSAAALSTHVDRVPPCPGRPEEKKP